MEADHTSYDLVSPFDPPSAVILPTRGVRWVLKWTAAVGVLVFATAVLAEFAYLAPAEQALARAARAGLVEATLPRASFDSVRATIERRLESYPGLANRVRLSLTNNSTPTNGILQPRDGDRLSIVLTADSDAALPTWLKTIRFWRSGPQLRVHDERAMPSRKLVFGARLPTSPKR
jgi:hypothetical protein